MTIADTRNQRLRQANLGQLSFSSQAVGTVSVAQSITVANTGTGALTIPNLSLQGPFVAAGGGTCPAVPIVLQPGVSCTENIAYAPVASGIASGSITLGGPAAGTQTVLLSGAAATAGATAISLKLTTSVVLSGEATTFTATVTVQGGASAPTGSVSFYDGATPLGSSPLVNGVATLTTANLPDGMQTITAVYASGGASFGSSTSIPAAESVADFSLSPGGAGTATVEPGHTLAVPLTLTAANATGLNGSVSFTIAGLPTGLTASVAPGTTPLNNGQLPLTLNVTAAPASQASLHAAGAGGALLALIFAPFFARRRHRLRTIRPLMMLLWMAGGSALLATLAGCGGNTGFFGQPQATYNLTVNATATDSTGGVLTRSTIVVVTVQ